MYAFIDIFSSVYICLEFYVTAKKEIPKSRKYKKQNIQISKNPKATNFCIYVYNTMYMCKNKHSSTHHRLTSTADRHSNRCRTYNFLKALTIRMSSPAAVAYPNCACKPHRSEL